MNIKSLLNIKSIKENKKVAICLVAGIIGILLIFASEMFKKPVKVKEETNPSNSQYEMNLEEKLTNLICSIDGAGKTKVLLTIEETEEKIYAQDSSLNRTDELNRTEQKDFVIVDDSNGKNGLLIKTVNPKIRGVAIVCEGGDNPIVQQRIYSCVSATLGISTSRISISKMTSTEVKNEK